MESLAVIAALVFLSMVIGSGISIVLAFMDYHYAALGLGLVVFIAAMSVTQGSINGWIFWGPPLVAIAIATWRIAR